MIKLKDFVYPFARNQEIELLEAHQAHQAHAHGHKEYNKCVNKPKCQNWNKLCPKLVLQCNILSGLKSHNLKTIHFNPHSKCHYFILQKYNLLSSKLT